MLGVWGESTRPDEGKPTTRDGDARNTALTIPKTARDRTQRFEKEG